MVNLSKFLRDIFSQILFYMLGKYQTPRQEFGRFCGQLAEKFFRFQNIIFGALLQKIHEIKKIFLR